MAEKLKNKTALITGGSSGMALATAKLFVAEGARVFITGRDEERLARAVAEIGGKVTGIAGDAAEVSDLDRVFDQIRTAAGSLDILFASAGYGAIEMLGDMTEEAYDRTFGLNVKGTLLCVSKALPLLADGASVFLNGSSISIKGTPGFGLYAASKAALRSLVRTLAVEQKSRRIRFNVLSPGTIDTPLIEPLSEAAKEHFRATILRGELGRSEEIATAALFLASEDSAFVNGTDLFVDGGACQI